ncbi:MAG: putative membrane protein YczE [Candidatus Poriferisodalaceae bacterium]|jgi:uncharacterized membrane protein YczE
MTNTSAKDLRVGAGVLLPVSEQAKRLPQLFLGLVMFGIGVAVGVIGDVGLPPWDLFHRGIAAHTPLSFGLASITVGLALLIVVLALGERVGIGTLGNVFVIGATIDLVLWLIDTPSSLVARTAFTMTGPIFIGLGSGLYLGVRLGPGTRDGLMTALSRRGVTVWKARTAIEASAFAGGLILGSRAGFGTVWFLITVGPCVQFFLPRFVRPAHPKELP